MESEEAVLVHLQSVAMGYDSGEDVLRDVDLTLHRGSFHFLVGPSGSGKTSLLRVISLSHPVRRGSMRFFGRDVAKVNREELSHIRRRISVIFQDFRLLDHLSAFNNVALPLRINQVDEAQIQRHVTEMLSWLGLGDVMKLRPPQLSVGQRQLVTVARAVVTRPSILLADEPLSNLDVERARKLMHLFVELNRLGTVVLVATHNTALLRRYRFGVLELDRGRIIQEHSPSTLATADRAETVSHA